jgi:rhodanese-related sulfurtransferase
MNGNSYNFQELYNEKFLNKLNFLNETKIFNELQNNKKIIVFDLRSRNEYEIYHCENSINVPIEEIEIENISTFNEQFLSQFTKDDSYKTCLLSKYKRLFVAIVCSQNRIKKSLFLTSTKKDDAEEMFIGKILIFYQSLINNKIREIGLFVKGYKMFHENYNFVSLQGNELTMYF